MAGRQDLMRPDACGLNLLLIVSHGSVWGMEDALEHSNGTYDPNRRPNPREEVDFTLPLTHRWPPALGLTTRSELELGLHGTGRSAEQLASSPHWVSVSVSEAQPST